MSTSWPPEVAVLIPVYNHVRTVGQVVAGCRALGANTIIVVDDGSSDGSGEAAAAGGICTLLRVSPNQGKGHALSLGLRAAAEAGFARVLALDADMQHPPSEALRLALASADDAEALWLGERDMAGAPASSRFGRWWTSLWTWVACGVWPGDNQTGLRVYPLPAMTRLPVRAGRYAFEVESLVRAVWSGICIRRLPVAVIYPADRISHFHKLKDNLRTAWAFTRLVTRRCLPWPHVRVDGESPWRAALSSGLSPSAVARAAALGAALGVAPAPGFQMLIAGWLALVLRQNPAVVLVASNISLGPLLAAWFALAVVIGHALREGDLTGLDVQLNAVFSSVQQHGAWTTLRPLLADWLIGSPFVMAIAAVIGGTIGWIISSGFNRRHG
jgi:uncharacterized protein (DUF2062 family)